MGFDQTDLPVLTPEEQALWEASLVSDYNEGIEASFNQLKSKLRASYNGDVMRSPADFGMKTDSFIELDMMELGQHLMTVKGGQITREERAKMDKQVMHWAFRIDPTEDLTESQIIMWQKFQVWTYACAEEYTRIKNSEWEALGKVHAKSSEKEM